MIVPADGEGLVSQAGAVLQVQALRVTGLDRGLREALGRWRAPRGTRQGATAEDQGYDAKAHVLADTGQLAGLDGDASLLENFPPHRIPRVLIQLDDPAGQDPFPVVGPLDSEHPAVLADDSTASADRVAGEIIPVVAAVAAGHFESCAFRVFSS